MRGWGEGALKAVAALLAILSLILIFLFGLSLFPESQSLLNDNAHPVSILITLAFVLGGLVLWFSREARRQRRRAADISSVGMSALVDPLLEIGLNLFELRRNPQEFIEAWDKAMAGPRPPTRLKWEFGGNLREMRGPLAGWKDQWPVPEWNTVSDWNERARRTSAQVSDQAVRRLMGTLRSWADLLATTSLGETAMVALGDLRLRLFRLSEECRDESRSFRSSGQPVSVQDQIADCALRSLLLAMIFEACGGASRPRFGFVSPLDEWDMPRDLGVDPAWVSRFKTDDSRELPSPVDQGLALLTSYGNELTHLGGNRNVLCDAPVARSSEEDDDASQAVP